MGVDGWAEMSTCLLLSLAAVPACYICYHLPHTYCVRIARGAILVFFSSHSSSSWVSSQEGHPPAPPKSPSGFHAKRGCDRYVVFPSCRFPFSVQSPTLYVYSIFISEPSFVFCNRGRSCKTYTSLWEGDFFHFTLVRVGLLRAGLEMAILDP